MHCIMGWRNGFIEIDQDKNSIDQILKFIDHHNNWNMYFEEEEIKRLWEKDEIPGEDIILKIIEDVKEKKFWAHIGSYGGMGHSEMWAERYFPNLKIYNSSDWPHYDYGEDDDKESWTKWPLYTVEQYKSNQQNI